MYSAFGRDAPASKFYLSQGQLPKKIDAEQPPSKKQPFSAILKHAFTHSVSPLPLLRARHIHLR